MSVKRAWNLMKEHNAVTLPITTKDGKLEALITTGDIAKSYMDAYDNTILAQARTQYRSIADTVDGEILVGNEHAYFVKERSGSALPIQILWKIILRKMTGDSGKQNKDQLCHRGKCQLSDRLFEC